MGADPRVGERPRSLGGYEGSRQKSVASVVVVVVVVVGGKCIPAEGCNPPVGEVDPGAIQGSGSVVGYHWSGQFLGVGCQSIQLLVPGGWSGVGVVGLVCFVVSLW